jgi:hypothetical protein
MSAYIGSGDFVPSVNSSGISHINIIPQRHKPFMLQSMPAPGFINDFCLAE